MASVSSFLERKLRLRVNREKSAVAPVWERKFLGHRLLPGGRLGLAPESLKRVKARIRRKLRCVRLKQRKRSKAIADFLQGLGVPDG